MSYESNQEAISFWLDRAANYVVAGLYTLATHARKQAESIMRINQAF